jgi:hypothetical protein
MLPLSQRRLSRRIAAPAPIRGIGRAIQNTDHKFTVPRLTACLCTALSLAVCLPSGALAAEKAEDRNIVAAAHPKPHLVRGREWQRRRGDKRADPEPIVRPLTLRAARVPAHMTTGII